MLWPGLAQGSPQEPQTGPLSCRSNAPEKTVSEPRFPFLFWRHLSARRKPRPRRIWDRVPSSQVDALRVADAPRFSTAETVIGSFAGRLQAVGRVRWHGGRSTRLAFLVESSWPLGGFAPLDVLRACRTTTRSQTGQTRASLTASNDNGV